MKNVMVFSGSRSDYSRLLPVCREIEQHDHLNLQLVAGAQHHMDAYGNTIAMIRESGMPLAGEVVVNANPEVRAGACKIVAEGTKQLSDLIVRLKPDLMLMLGDRFELLSVASACICMGVPMAHVGGGQITEGALDEQVRHMITKAAHIHFVANKTFGDRLIAMGEEPRRVFATGSPSIDCLAMTEVVGKEALADELGLDLRKQTALVTLHPESAGDREVERDSKTFFRALSASSLQFILTYPNGDPGSDVIIRHMKEFHAANRVRSVLVKNLGMKRYVSAMRYCSLVVGNSSSGIVEAPYFQTPVVNVGERQKGRTTAENVISCSFDKEEILRSIREGLKLGRKPCESPYGDGESAPRIVERIVQVLEGNRQNLLTKSFYKSSEALGA